MPTKVKLSSKWKGMSGFLDMKQAFDDGLRQQRWEKEKLLFAEGSQEKDRAFLEKQLQSKREETLIGAGYLKPTMVREGTPPSEEAFQITPEQQNKVANLLAVSSGLSPESRQRLDEIAATGMTKETTAKFGKAMDSFLKTPEVMKLMPTSEEERMGLKLGASKLYDITSEEGSVARQVQAWLSGTDIQVGSNVIRAPRSQEEAFWELLGRGIDPLPYMERILALRSNRRLAKTKPIPTQYMGAGGSATTSPQVTSGLTAEDIANTYGF
jgi:hypothetical protein